MKKLTGYEQTYYPDRWEHNGHQICMLRDGVYLFFTGKFERSFGCEDEIVKAFGSLEEAEEFLDHYDNMALVQEDPNQKAHDLYYKLHKCLKIALTAPIQPNGDDLSVHANSIIRHLAKSIESGETWYDASLDNWCDYFLNMNKG